MNIKSTILFQDSDNPESGYLAWNWQGLFRILDSNMNEIDCFTVNGMNGYAGAYVEANRHFEQVASNLREIENGIKNS